MSEQVNQQERMLRRKLQKAGYALRKSRVKNINIDNLGGYMITDIRMNAVVGGSRFDLDLEDVEEFVQRYA